MTELIEIPINYKGEKLIIQAELLQRGYIHGLQVLIDDIPVLFEPDEERNYRAMINETKYDKNKIDSEMLKSIVETLESLK